MAILHTPDADPTPDDEAFWTHCRHHDLRFQRCTACGSFRHPPGPMCPRCGVTQCVWVPATRDGVLYSFTTVHHPPNPDLRDDVPYVIGIVEFAGSGGVRLVTNIVGTDLADVRIAARVRLCWDDARAWPLPVFTIDTGSENS